MVCNAATHIAPTSLDLSLPATRGGPHPSPPASLPLLRTDDVSADTEIQCELIHVPLKDPGDYEALSYVWGAPLQTHTIKIKTLGQEEETVPVTESLWVALRYL